MLVGEDKAQPPDLLTSLAAHGHLVPVQAWSVIRGNSPVRQTEETIPAFQSVFPKYFLMKGMHPLFEPDERPVYLSSWTLQAAGEGGKHPSITQLEEKGNYSGEA